MGGNTSTTLLLGTFIFLFIFSFLLSEMTGTTMELLSPITLGVTGSVLVGVIAVANTPIAKGGALAILFVTIAGYFVFSPVPPLILGIVIVPIFLSTGLAFAEVGQG